jgi:signal transduction histidine kinase
MVGVLAEKKRIMVNEIFYLDGKSREDLIGEPKLNVDRTRCEQIFINLLTNAVKYSPEQSQIHCRVRYVFLNGLRCAKVQIINEGGMKSNDVKKALARFGTLSEGQYTTHEGAVGLGTSIVQGLVELHAGKFELLSRKTPNANLTIANVYLPF